MAVAAYANATLQTTALTTVAAQVAQVSSLGDTGEGLGIAVSGVVVITTAAGTTNTLVQLRQGAGVAGTVVDSFTANLPASTTGVVIPFELYDPSPVPGSSNTYAVVLTPAAGTSTVTKVTVKATFLGTD